MDGPARLKTSDFDYELPGELIAQTPIEPRDHSRLMVVDQRSGSIHHRRFYQLPDYLGPGDVLVFNDSRVVPARLYGVSIPSGARIELLLLERLEQGVWRSLVKPGKRMRRGARFEIGGKGRRVTGSVTAVNDDGTRDVALPDDNASFPQSLPRTPIRGREPSDQDFLDELGVIPLPPYIHEPLADPERYQTVYSRAEGSIAAPTAGLHFTPDLLERVREMGVELVFVTLHVGWDSFRPVASESIKSHGMHSEYWQLGLDAGGAVNRAKSEGRRVISVGTTAVRLLEHAASLQDETAPGVVAPGSGRADLFIYPGYQFRVVDALITNFHLPRSTLLMLTSAFAGRELVLRAYKEAVNRRYRLYSFGDAMLIV